MHMKQDLHTYNFIFTFYREMIDIFYLLFLSYIWITEIICVSIYFFLLLLKTKKVRVYDPAWSVPIYKPISYKIFII